jgi:hypothetical protein
LSVTWLLPSVATRLVGAYGAETGALGVAVTSFELPLSPAELDAVTT